MCESTVPALAIAEQHGADDAMDMIQAAYEEQIQEVLAADLAASSGHVAAADSQEAPAMAEEISVAPMDVDSAVPALAVAEQHGADEAADMIQAAFDERARELEAEMLSARRSYEAALRARGGA